MGDFKLKNYNKKDCRKVIALCVGGKDAEYQSIIIDVVSKMLQKNDVKVLLFQAFSNCYFGGTNEIGDFNIYNLINYNLIDGVIISPMSIKCPDSVENIRKNCIQNNLPLVSIDGQLNGAFNILLGYADCIYTLTKHIIECHHKTKINFMGGPDDNDIANERKNAYKRALLEHNIPYEEERTANGWFWNTTAANCVKEYYNKYHELPEAFICANDSMAIGVCEGVQELGFSVPKDVLVTGLDGITEAVNYSPKITTARLNLKGASAKAVEVMLDFLNDDSITDYSGETTVESEILYTNSCGCVPIEFNTDNRLKHNLYMKIDFKNTFFEKNIKMIEQVTGASSLMETISRLEPYVLRFWANKVWVCICETYLSDVGTIEDRLPTKNSYRINGYDRKMNCVIYREGENENAKILEPKGLFDSYTMLPDFENEMNKDNVSIMFYPLHYQDRAIGYIATTYNDFFDGYVFDLDILIMNISILLENSRVQSELQYTVQHLQNMYIHDPLTNIYNRRGFYQYIPQLVYKCHSQDKLLMVISVDLDGLKPINDIYGHKEGDNAITTVAKTLSSIAVNDEVVARFGGDEYMVAGCCETPEHAKQYVNRLKDCLDYYNNNSQKPYKVQASCGIYCTKVPSVNDIVIDDLIKIADEYMYKEKETHKYNRRR